MEGSERPKGRSEFGFDGSREGMEEETDAGPETEEEFIAAERKGVDPNAFPGPSELGFCR